MNNKYHAMYSEFVAKSHMRANTGGQPIRKY